MIVNGQVINSKGFGIAAVYAYLDQSGNIVSDIYRTDSAGNFAIELIPSNSIWINFYSPGYISTVYTTEEIYQNPNLILPTDESKQIKVLPVVLILAAAFFIGQMKDRKKKVGKITKAEILPIVAIGGGVLGFTLLKQLFEKLGIWDSADTKELNADSSNPLSPWSPIYWRNKPANVPFTYAITTTTAQAYSKELYDAFGAFNDCEECAKAVIKRLRTKANLSFLADVFSTVYGQDLLSFLRGGYWPQDRLSDADVNELNQYVKNLPAY